MSVEAVASLSSDQARADAASLRLAAALALEQSGPNVAPGDVERSEAAAAAARADLARADAAVRADEATTAPAANPAPTSPNQNDVAPASGHVVELIV